MNERIRELAEQATTYIEPTATSGEGWIFNKEKFAESIVKECASICMELAAKCAGLPYEGALAIDCANLIKQDFGVEL